MIRTTHTYAELELSSASYDEIAEKLRHAGYHHSFLENGIIDMHGIGVSRGAEAHPVVQGVRQAEAEPSGLGRLGLWFQDSMNWLRRFD